jgi:hypothetical protein
MYVLLIYKYILKNNLVFLNELSFLLSAFNNFFFTSYIKFN